MQGLRTKDLGSESCQVHTLLREWAWDVERGLSGSVKQIHLRHISVSLEREN